MRQLARRARMSDDELADYLIEMIETGRWGRYFSYSLNNKPETKRRAKKTTKRRRTK